MNKIAAITLTAAAFVLSACSGVPTQSKQEQNSTEVAPYPAPDAGYHRSVIFLPPLKDEQNAKVELMVGKEMLVDCNFTGLSGSITQHELKGWGYQYYVVKTNNQAFSTMMACSDVDQKIDFVNVNNNLGLIQYNSGLPIVVYAPQDIQVKYRVWATKPNINNAVVEQ
ncbi:serine protease inhibitor ecotin [Orbaceae bacterium ac157xtp]